MGEDFMNLAGASLDFDKISRIYSKGNWQVLKRKQSELPSTPFRSHGLSIDLDINQHFFALNMNNKRYDDDDGYFVALDNYEMNPEEMKKFNE